jgi:biotin carboxylase
MNKKTVLIINAERSYYEPLKLKYNLLFREPNFNASPYEQATGIIDWLKESNQEIDAVVGYLDAHVAIASIIAERLHLAAPSVEAMYVAQNKAEFSRRMALNKLPYPLTQEIDISTDELPSVGYPLFLKPDKGSLSAYSYVIESEDDYKEKRTILRQEKNVSQPVFNHFFSHFNKKYAQLGSWFVVQSMSSGVQYNIDGVVIDGKVFSLGIIKTLTTADGKSFTEFVYPADVSEQFIVATEKMATEVLAAVGFDNSGFNIEYFAKENGEMAIIELNPRMGPGFFPLFEQRYESSCFEILFQVALREEPNFALKNPSRKAVSYPLRVFTDRFVEKVPTQERFRQLEKDLDIVEIDIWIQEGEKLSNRRQDAYSFRYGLVHIGGDSFEEVVAKKDRLMQILADELIMQEITD